MSLRELLKKKNMLLKKSTQPEARSSTYRHIDIAAVHAIVQAAVNVEEFTIPLYMCSLYSIQGMHAITGDNKLYEGRMWPGSATTSTPDTDNKNAFNKIFKVFIEEMLHLQLVGNIAHCVGVAPKFTSEELMTEETYAWTCYGPELTTIPHILDFKDVKQGMGNDIKVNLGPLNKEQIKLFLAIEETEENAIDRIQPDKLDKYFPTAPFEKWYIGEPLPMFGSIGWMYACLWQYLSIEYDEGPTLWEALYHAPLDELERDLFNEQEDGHPKKEYPNMDMTVANPQDPRQTEHQAKMRVLDMISGITDQGEGNAISDIIRESMGVQPLLTSVRNRYQANKPNLAEDYPSYNDVGVEVDSTDAAARGDEPNVALDHFEIFTKVNALLDTGDIVTWDQWHKAGNAWTPQMLKTASYDKNEYGLPSAEDVSAALNRLKENDSGDANYKIMCQASAGAIKGITTVLDKYWADADKLFPYPSMAGSGDRMSICWAVFGKTPLLSFGSPEKESGLYHACQGLSLDPNLPSEPDHCALVPVYHTCKGSNTCKGEGGCGFIQTTTGGSNCGDTVSFARSGPKQPAGNDCSPIYYSAPSDNLCMSKGGCAVPISASQLFPKPRAPKSLQDTQAMKLFNIVEEEPSGLGFFPYDQPDMDSPYKEGASVYGVAWDAYVKVLEANNEAIPNKPAPSDLRLAFPPST